MIDLSSCADDYSGVRALCLEARHSISREIAKKRRQEYESSIFIPKIYSRNISPFKMAPKDEELTKSYRDQRKRSLKIRPKPLLDRRKLQHPESFPLPKKQHAKQVFPAVESFRESTFDKQPLKDFGSRKHRPASGADKPSSSLKSQSKSWKIKLPINPKGERSSSLTSYPEKFMMEVTKVSNDDDNKVSVSVASSIESGMPNFILCCESKSILKNECNRTRGGNNNQSSVEATKQGREKIPSELYDENPTSSTQQSKDMQKESFESIEQELNQCEDLSEGSAEDEYCCCHCANCTCSSMRSGAQDLSQGTRDAGDNLDNWLHRYNSDSSELKAREQDMKEDTIEESDSQGQEVETSAAKSRKREDKSLENDEGEISTSGCEESSDELAETDDCQQDTQNGSARIYSDANNTYRGQPTCACCCTPEAIPNNKEEMQLNSEYMEWLKIQHGNNFFPYPFCCPEGVAPYFGCCAGTSMPSLPTESAPPGNQPIQPPAQTFDSPSLGMPIDKESYDQPSGTQRRSINSAYEDNGKSYSRRSPEPQNGRQRTGKRRNQKYEMNNSTARPETPSSGNYQPILSDSRPSLSANNAYPENTSAQNPQTWSSNNNFGCFPQPPCYGCNVCPPYQGPWCFPWWYSVPFGFELCYRPPVAPSNMNLQPPQSPRQANPSSPSRK